MENYTTKELRNDLFAFVPQTIDTRSALGKVKHLLNLRGTGFYSVLNNKKKIHNDFGEARKELVEAEHDLKKLLKAIDKAAETFSNSKKVLAALRDVKQAASHGITYQAEKIALALTTEKGEDEGEVAGIKPIKSFKLWSPHLKVYRSGHRWRYLDGQTSLAYDGKFYCLANMFHEDHSSGDPKILLKVIRKEMKHYMDMIKDVKDELSKLAKVKKTLFYSVNTHSMGKENFEAWEGTLRAI